MVEGSGCHSLTQLENGFKFFKLAIENCPQFSPAFGSCALAMWLLCCWLCRLCRVLLFGGFGFGLLVVFVFGLLVFLCGWGAEWVWLEGLLCFVLWVVCGC